jgi:hypothetical protein
MVPLSQMIIAFNADFGDSALHSFMLAVAERCKAQA